MQPIRFTLQVIAASLTLSLAYISGAHAAADEIQVYDGGLADPGVFNLTWHNNYTISGDKTEPYPANHALNGVTEWAYGVNNWWEVGLYLPLYTINEGGGTRMNGFKLRTLFATPNAADRKFFYGFGMELGRNAKSWSDDLITSEFRPIVGWHLGKVDVIFNPILGTNYKDGLGGLAFSPSTRVAYNASKNWAFALEEYAGLGTLNDLHSETHQLYGVVDYAGESFELQAGLGFGLTDASDNTVFKLIFARDF